MSFSPHICHFIKYIYWLKKVTHAWYDKLDTFLLDKGFIKGTYDDTLYFIKQGSDILQIKIYVDDILFNSNNSTLLNECIAWMTNTFEMSML